MAMHIIRVYSVECDDCGEGYDAPGAMSAGDARTESATDGWVRARDKQSHKLVDLCRACAKKYGLVAESKRNARTT